VALGMSGVGPMIPARRRRASSRSSMVTVVIAAALGIRSRWPPRRWRSLGGRRHELPFLGLAEVVAVEFNLEATAAAVIEIEQ